MKSQHIYKKKYGGGMGPNFFLQKQGVGV